MLHCHRVGFAGVDPNGYDGPEISLEHVLRRLDEDGHRVVSVSVMRSSRDHERYEAFIVYQTTESPGDAQ